MSFESLSDDLLIEIFKKLECQRTILNLRRVCKRTRNLVDYEPLIESEKEIMAFDREFTLLLKLNFNIYKNILIDIRCREFNIPKLFWKNIRRIEAGQYDSHSLEHLQLERYDNLETFKTQGAPYYINKDLNIKTLIVCHSVRITCPQTHIENLIGRFSFSDIKNLLALKKVNLTKNTDSHYIINYLPNLEYLEIYYYIQDVNQYRAKHLAVYDANIDLRKCKSVETLELRRTRILEVMNLQNLRRLLISGAYHNSGSLLISDLPSLEDLSIDKLYSKNYENRHPDLEITIRNVPKLRCLHIDAKIRYSYVYLFEVPESVRELYLQNVKVKKVNATQLDIVRLHHSNMISYAHYSNNLKKIKKISIYAAEMPVEPYTVDRIEMFSNNNSLYIHDSLITQHKSEFEKYFIIKSHLNYHLIEFKHIDINITVNIAGIEFYLIANIRNNITAEKIFDRRKLWYNEKQFYVL